LNGFYLIWAFNFQKNSTVPYKSWKKISSKLGAKGIKRSGILRWFQKCVEFSHQEVPKDFFSEKRFIAKFYNSLKIQFFCKKIFPLAKLKTSAHFWNQRKIPLLLIPCTANFGKKFPTLIRGGDTFFRG
jgi:hypothetical protein